ncbi:metallophosphoesterase [Hymenobacter psychrotolerans]|uniref:Calcineurin-like phosphoesterase n=1 Tax=Hymenobacter psychrotolerans DSM 18569 TaxID=1121959 RepID=A0A1M7BWH7_9BACT|nr:metallophosphoesterase [Hymenobacter psychrotolerans]SHL59388.1 Calcineurin-like phosphoesterase [Hymenobacter psychrotolerans DSM 18569]
MKRFLLSCGLLLTACMAPAWAQKPTQTPHTSRPNYNHGSENWESRTPPDSTRLRYTVFLIGDVGKPIETAKGGEPSLNYLRKQILSAGAKSTTIYLGDNIYEYGMPEEGAYDRKESERRIVDQLNVLRNYAGEKYMIPGNHDWKQGRKGAVDQVNRQQRFVENFMSNDSAAFSYTGDFFIPRDACPGPFEVRLQDNVVMIAINSQWFLQGEGERPYGSNSGCGVANETDFFTQLEDIISQNKDKNIMVVAHHPILSDGIHGGFFTLADHIFPLSIVYKYAFLPLPVIGSVYPFARKYGGISQDIPHPLYQAYKKGLEDIFAKHPNIVYAAGHEHNLQYFKADTYHQIVSGSGCKTQHVRTGRDADAHFSDKEKGFARVNYYDDGQAWVEFWIPNGAGETGRLVYRTPLYAQTPVATDSVAVPLAGLRPNFRDSTVTVAVNTRYDDRSRFHKFLFGEHYRREWATPVTFPVLDLATEKGGLTPYKIGGGKQTASLKVRNEEGRNFTIRSLNKDPSAVLPEALRTGAAADILQDQISAQHPFGALPIPPLASAAGILHTNPELRYIPQDPLLGQYLERFGNTPGAIEEDAKDDQSNVASLGNAKNLVGTDKVFERITDDNDNRVNEKAFARSRLFDMWIGDWDRHEDQWRWAEKKDKDGDRKFTAVPEDRDVAFFKGDGLFPYLASRKWAIRNFQNFGKDYADWKGLNLTALSNDRVYLASVTREQWVQQAEEMKASLTDAVIEQAFRERWPQQIYDLHAQEIIGKLKSRRDLLPEVAADYYTMLSKVTEVKGSKKREKFVVERLPDNKTRVSVQKINKEGELTKMLFDRTFDNKVTKELRLYGFDGNDIYDLKGDVKSGPRIRVIAGTGRDSIVDRSNVAGFRNYTHIYDADTGNVIVPGRDTRLRTEPGIDVSRYDVHNRSDRKDYTLNYFGPTLYFGYNVDDRLFLGGGATYRTYGFRKEPYASEQSLAANYSPSQRAYNIRYLGHFVDVIGKYDLRVNAQYYGPQLLYNYFGEGNDTRNILADDASTRARDINQTYRVRFSRLYVSPVLERDVFSFLNVGFGPQYDQFQVERNPIGREIAAGLDENNNGVSGAALGIRSSDFQLNRYLGGRAYLNIDAASSPKNPRIGLRWYNSVEYNYQLNAEKLKYGRLATEFRFYLTPNFPFQLTWAGRIGANRNIGDYRFYQANTLGGTTNLRGYRRTRFAGRSSVFANAEVRVQLFEFNAYLVPGKFGILGLADAARVYSPYDSQTGIKAFHTGVGGGVWADILKQAVINATYSVGEENLVFVGFDFLF